MCWLCTVRRLRALSARPAGPATLGDALPANSSPAHEPQQPCPAGAALLLQQLSLAQTHGAQHTRSLGLGGKVCRSPVLRIIMNEISGDMQCRDGTPRFRGTPGPTLGAVFRLLCCVPCVTGGGGRGQTDGPRGTEAALGTATQGDTGDASQCWLRRWLEQLPWVLCRSDGPVLSLCRRVHSCRSLGTAPERPGLSQSFPRRRDPHKGPHSPIPRARTASAAPASPFRRTSVHPTVMRSHRVTGFKVPTAAGSRPSPPAPAPAPSVPLPSASGSGPTARHGGRGKRPWSAVASQSTPHSGCVAGCHLFPSGCAVPHRVLAPSILWKTRDGGLFKPSLLPSLSL